MSRYISIVSLLAGAVVIAGCAKSPETAVENFYAAVGKGEITEAQGYLSGRIRGVLPPEKLAAGLTQEHKRIVSCGGIKGVDVKLEGEGEVRFGTATVSYRGDCKDKTEKVELAMEDGQWKLQMGDK